MFTFVNTIPGARGHAEINKHHCRVLLEACIDNPNQWAEVPITYLYPDATGYETKQLVSRCRNIASRINNRLDLPPFNEYACEAHSRGTTLYVRVRINKRDLKNLY